MVDVQKITETLAEMGLSLTYTVLDSGDYKTASKFQVTITKGRQSFSTEYTKGAGHRRWKERLSYGVIGTKFGIMAGLKHIVKPGAKVPHVTKMSIADQSMLLQNSEPIPPSLDEVMYSLVLDTSGVRHGQDFADFASEFGYDSDSIKAKKIYKACVKEWQALVRMGLDLDRLQELFAEY